MPCVGAFVKLVGPAGFEPASTCYEQAALTAMLRADLVDQDGLEPTTSRLKDGRSTAELLVRVRPRIRTETDPLLTRVPLPLG